MLRLEMVLQVTLLGSCVVAHGAIELPWIHVELHVLFEVAPICCFVVTVWAIKRLGPVVDLPSVASYFMLIRGHIAALIAFKRFLT